jgi:hypothetical protein
MAMYCQSLKLSRYVVHPFSSFDFTKDDWAAYIVIPLSDFTDLNKQIARRTCLKTTDRKILLQMQQQWQFKVTAGDMATVESVFYLVKNRKNSIPFAYCFRCA